MKIIPYECGYVFIVESRSRSGVHMVDLSANDYLGACACEHFQFTCLPLYRVSGERIDHGSGRTRCDHILACREWFTNDLIKRLLKNEEPKTKSSSVIGSRRTA